MTAVTVKAGIKLYRSGSTHPFQAGDTFEIDAAEAENLVKFGHVDLADKAAAEPPAEAEQLSLAHSAEAEQTVSAHSAEAEHG